MSEQPAVAPTAATSPVAGSNIQQFSTSYRFQKHRLNRQEAMFQTMVHSLVLITEQRCNQAILNCSLCYYLNRLIDGKSLHEDMEKRLSGNPTLQHCMRVLVATGIRLQHRQCTYILAKDTENRARAVRLRDALRPVVEHHQQQLNQLTRT